MGLEGRIRDGLGREEKRSDFLHLLLCRGKLGEFPPGNLFGREQRIHSPVEASAKFVKQLGKTV